MVLVQREPQDPGALEPQEACIQFRFLLSQKRSAGLALFQLPCWPARADGTSVVSAWQWPLHLSGAWCDVTLALTGAKTVDSPTLDCTWQHPLQWKDIAPCTSWSEAQRRHCVFSLR